MNLSRYLIFIAVDTVQLGSDIDGTTVLLVMQLEKDAVPPADKDLA